MGSFWTAVWCFTKECGLDLFKDYRAMVKHGWGQPEMGVPDRKWVKKCVFGAAACYFTKKIGSEVPKKAFRSL